MTAAGWLPLLSSVVVAILGGGWFGAWLAHKRLAPKSQAEAASITAAAMDQDWARFQREIGRLVKRLEDAEAKCDRAETKAETAFTKLHECEEREVRLRAELTSLRAYVDQQGQMRADAAAFVAGERVIERGES